MSSNTLFPNGRIPESMTMSVDSIEIEGMRVLFDEKVSLFPVEVEEKKESTETHYRSRKSNAGKAKRIR